MNFAKNAKKNPESISPGNPKKTKILGGAKKIKDPKKQNQSRKTKKTTIAKKRQ